MMDLQNCIFAVADDGIGISEEDQERVFRSFEQVKDYKSIYKQGNRSWS